MHPLLILFPYSIPSVKYFLLFRLVFFITLSHCAVIETNLQIWRHLQAEKDAHIANRTAIVALDLSASASASKPPLLTEGRLKKTILLIDGEAEYSLSYKVQLKNSETLLNVFHVTNDSSIVTKHSEKVSLIKGAPNAMYNVSIVYEFEGGVGVVSYMLRVRTSLRRYIVSGTFYVAGIVAEIQNDGGVGIVSGMVSKGLSFQTPANVTLNSSLGQLPLPIVYQPSGMDVGGKLVALEDVMRTATIAVKYSAPDVQAPLIDFSPSVCTSAQPVMRDHTGFYQFRNNLCGIGYDARNNFLVLNLNRERGGTAVIEIATPAITANGEIFETLINLHVGKPSKPLPVLHAPKDIEIRLDHYGNEHFALQMYNTIIPAQTQNATLYVLSLPAKRYAQVDFSRSNLTNPLQKILFNTVAPGKEDAQIQKLIMQTALNISPLLVRPAGAVLGLPHGLSRTHTFSQTVQSHFDQYSSFIPVSNSDAAEHDAFIDSPRDVHHILLNAEENTSDSLPDTVTMRHMTRHEMPIGRSSEMAPAFESKVLVLIPPEKGLITAVNRDKTSIRSSFASDALASIGTVDTNATENISVKLKLHGYSIANFSEYKAQQIRKSLQTIALAFDKGTIGNATLVNLNNMGSSLEATYDLGVSGNSTEITKKLNTDPAVRSSIAQDARLDPARVESISARSNYARQLPSDITGSQEVSTSLSAPLGGAVIAAIVVLVGIVLFPLIVICFGIIVYRRSRDDTEPSNLNMDDSMRAVRNSSLPDVSPSSMAPSTVSTIIAQDGFGRVDDDVTQDSFKMQKEMFKDGYFGDNPDKSNS